MRESARILRTLGFLLAFLLLCWMGVQIVHEFGHVTAALLSGGQVSRIVLNPLTISRTDLSFNPYPQLTVWAGPLVGAGLPLLLWQIVVSVGRPRLSALAQFFCGFSLVANGAYLAFGASDGVGDCGVMRQCGTPVGLLMGVGALLLAGGFVVWHHLGSPLAFLKHAEFPRTADLAITVLLLIVVAGSCRLIFP